MIEVAIDKLKEYIKKGNKVVMIYANRCNYCPPVSLILEALEQVHNGKFELIKVDYDINPQCVDEMFKIEGLPTIVTMKDGVIQITAIGSFEKEQYVQIVDLLLS